MDEFKELCILKHYSETLSHLRLRDAGLDGWGSPGFGVPSFHGLVRGIVLRDVEQEREETRGSRKLVSIGTFHAVPQTKTGDRFELPGECSVDWIVL